MLKIRRIRVPLNLECNLHCKYCYRDLEEHINIPEFTEDMTHYLRQLDPSWCEAVVANGGEPLLHWDKVLELFSYVPNNVHKVIMTNGTLMTQDKIDYINANNIEIHLSHDGSQTEFLRGIDVLKDQNLVALFRQIPMLRIWSVVTKYNNDVWENFFDTITKLGRTNIYYDTFAVGCNNIAHQQDLIQDFDYDLFSKTLLEFRHSPYYLKHPYRDGHSLTDDPMKDIAGCSGFDMLPNGDVCGTTRLHCKFGSINTGTYNILSAQVKELGFEDKCANCEIKQHCFSNLSFSSDFTCNVKKRLIEYQRNNLEWLLNLQDSMDKLLPEIEQKYGYVRLQ